MIDTSIVRVHQHGACIAVNGEQLKGRSHGGFTSKVHAVVDTNGLPVRLPDYRRRPPTTTLFALLAGLNREQCCLRIVDMTLIGSEHAPSQHAARANIPTKRNRKEPTCFSPISTALVVWSRFFNKIKQYRRVATRYDKPAADYPTFTQLASIRLSLRVNESAP